MLKSKLKGHRTAIEHEVVTALDASLAEGVRVHLLADRGFGDQKLYELLRELAWDYTCLLYTSSPAAPTTAIIGSACTIRW